MSKTISVAQMTLKRETKGALLYENTETGLAITSIYLRKDGVASPYPKTITLTAVVDDDGS